MGLSDISEKFSDFHGIKYLFKSAGGHDVGEDVQGGEERGISGGPQKARRGGHRGRGRPWTRLDEDSEGNHIVLYAVRGSQVFFLLIALFINAAMAAFQRKWKTGTSGLVVFTFFVVVLALLHSLFCLIVPIVHERAGRMNSVARALKRPRPAFIINGLNTTLMLVMSFTLTISSNTEGCKDGAKDPHADLEGYLDALPKFCRNKRALTAFLWFAFFAWLISLVFTFLSWRRSRSSPNIPALVAPEDDKAEGSIDGDDGAHRYDSLPHVSSGYGDSGPYSGPSPVYESGGFSAPGAGSPVVVAAARQSTTFYEGGRPFDDPTPSGYGSSPYTNPYENATPAYEDPYDRIRRERGL